MIEDHLIENLARHAFPPRSAQGRLGGGFHAGLLSAAAGRRRNGTVGEQQRDQFAPNAFIRIDHTGKTTLIMPQVEMGQGVYTAIPQILADELDADYAKVALEHAPPSDKLYGNPLFGIQATGNSNSIRAFWKPLRIAGAAARAMLVRAAAEQWQVDPASCTASNGHGDSRGQRPHTGLRRSGGRGGSAAGAAGSAAQESERFRADRQAAQAARHAGQDQRQRRLWHRHHASRDEVRHAGGEPGVRRQGQTRRRQRRQNVPGVRQVVVLDDRGRRHRRPYVGRQERPRRSRHHLGRRSARATQLGRHLGGSARREQKGRRGREIRRRHRQRDYRRAKKSTASSSCRSWRTRRWSR